MLTYGLPSTPWHSGLLVDFRGGCSFKTLLKQWNQSGQSIVFLFFCVLVIAAQLWPNSASENWCDAWLIGRAFDNEGIMDRTWCYHALAHFFFFWFDNGKQPIKQVL